jgi:hypothetical protein
MTTRAARRWWRLGLAALLSGMGAGLSVALAQPASEVASPRPLPVNAADLSFLRELTRQVVAESQVLPGARVGDSPTNTCGFPLFMPGGRGGYPAFWIRDFAMSLDSGLISPVAIAHHLRLIARSQNGSQARPLRHGLRVPPFAVPDHINFDGGAVFYPGTYASGEDQGQGTYGFLPPVDDQYEFVHIAYCLFRVTGKADFLREEINGLALFDRLVAAFDCPRTDPVSGLVVTSEEERAVGFGFCDAVVLTGELLFPSLLRYRAAGELAVLCDATGRREAGLRYRRVQQSISRSVPRTFSAPGRMGGWLEAATGIGRQPDVWGTLYALHLGALRGAPARRATRIVIESVRHQTIVCEAGVRHVPTDADYSAASAWERTAGVARNTYQNGAYWHTPTGWLIEAVRQRDPELAARLGADYIGHLRRNDYRRGPAHGAPWECFHPGGYAQNGAYLTSVAVPYAVLSAPGLHAPVP